MESGWAAKRPDEGRSHWWKTSSALLAVVTALVLLGSSSCTGDKEQTYMTKAQIVRTTVNRKDANGTPLVSDVELDFPVCTGEVKKLIRGGGEFATCMAKVPPGTEVPVRLISAMKRDGRRASRVVQVGDCKRAPDPTDSRSYETVRICEKLETDGIVVGFKCDVQASDDVLAACPWLAR